MTNAEAGLAITGERAASPPLARHRLPRVALATLSAAVIGLAAQLLFFETAIGINFPIAIALLLAAGWWVRGGEQDRPPLADAWLPVAAIVFASFVALRGDARLQVLDALGALTLTGAALASLAGMPVASRPLGFIVVLAARVLGSIAAGAARALDATRRALPDGQLRRVSGRIGPVLRGLLIAIPLLLIFAMLFASADAIFESYLDDLFDLDLGSIPGRVAITVVAFWLAAGALAFVAEPTPIDEVGAEGAWERRPAIGRTEALTVLLTLDALFAVFVGLQAAYLFGGLDTLAASGMTYAEYARRGFFELLAVAFGVGGLITLLQVLRREHSRAYLAAAIVLVLLTVVILASAYLRLRLYQDAYGWTELRFYVLAAIGWLALGALLAVGALATGRFAWMGHAMIGLSLLFGLAFNVIGPVRYVAEQNVARAIQPDMVPDDGETGLDVCYLASLGTDAQLVLARALPQLPPDVRREVLTSLEVRAVLLARSTAESRWPAWNLSREEARLALRGLYTSPILPYPGPACPY